MEGSQTLHILPRADGNTALDTFVGLIADPFASKVGLTTVLNSALSIHVLIVVPL